jgi:hypothetical protein
MVTEFDSAIPLYTWALGAMCGDEHRRPDRVACGVISERLVTSQWARHGSRRCSPTIASVPSSAQRVHIARKAP